MPVPGAAVVLLYRGYGTKLVLFVVGVEYLGAVPVPGAAVVLLYTG